MSWNLLIYCYYLSLYVNYSVEDRLPPISNLSVTKPWKLSVWVTYIKHDYFWLSTRRCPTKRWNQTFQRKFIMLWLNKILNILMSYYAGSYFIITGSFWVSPRTTNTGKMSSENMHIIWENITLKWWHVSTLNTDTLVINQSKYRTFW